MVSRCLPVQQYSRLITCCRAPTRLTLLASLAADPSRRRSRSSRSSGARAPPALADDISQLSLGSPPTVSAARPTASSSAPASSKSVLTIALQRAQSAVLLDSANNVPAAIAAYSQSVRLLKEVMARVDESARREREKEAARGYYRSVPRAGETFEDFERRVARTERKERAKQDEARRLKVIVSSEGSELSCGCVPDHGYHVMAQHDTYEDRIRMLQAVQSPSIGTEDGSAPSTPSTVHAEVSQSIVEPSPGSAALSRREGRSIQSLSTVSTPPATFAPATALPALDVEQVPPTKDLNASSLPSPAIEGIGSAMLVSSPPTSPTGSILPSFVTNAAPTVVTNGHDLEPPQQAAPTQRETLEACADVQQRVTYGASNVPTSPRAAPQSPVSPKSPGQSKLDTSKRISRLPRSTSLDTFPINVSLDRPLNSEVADDVVASLGDDEFHAGAVMQRTGSAPSATAYAMGRTASGSSMQRTASGESAASSRGTSLFGPGGFRQLAGQDVPSSGAEHNSISARYSAPAFGLGPPPSLSPTVASRPRPARSASSASTPVAAFADETESHHFVSASAAHGTNGQRRKLAPAQDSTVLEVDEESNDGGEGVEYVLPLRQGHQRGPSAEPTIPNEFGLAPQSSSGSYASASLPTRLRTFSQPAGKRPGLPSYHSEQPNLPPLHINTARSIAGSDSTPSFSRKTSLPIGISQHPPLKRSNSAASQQSLGDRDRESRIYSPTSTGADTPTFPSFPRGTAAPPLNLMSSPPLDGSFLADTSALSSVRRPFHLMRLILDTLEGEGAHLTPRLYVPHQVWSQSGVKLVAVETKVRMLDLLRGGLEVVTRSGEAWSAGRATAGSFARELDSLEGLMDGIQSTLSKKLGYGPSGKKAVAVSLKCGQLSRPDVLTRNIFVELIQCMELQAVSLTGSSDEWAEVRLRTSGHALHR